MKKEITLILIILGIVGGINAQIPTNTHKGFSQNFTYKGSTQYDSILVFLTDPDKSYDSVLYYIEKYKYIDDIVTVEYWLVDENSGICYPSHKYGNKYDENGNPLIFTNYIYSGDWVRKDSTIRRYSSTNKMLEAVSFRWRNGSWEKQVKETFNYDSLDNLISIISYEWEIDSWIEGYKTITEYTYDSEADEYIGIQSLWDYNNSKWEKQSKLIRKFNQDKYLIKEIGYYLNSNQEWTFSYEYNYTYDENGNMLSTISNNSKQINQYNDADQLIYKEDFFWNNSIEEWIPYTKHVAKYDENGTPIFRGNYIYNTNINDWEINNEHNYIVFYEGSFSVYYTITDGTNPIEGASITIEGYGTKVTDSEGEAVFYGILTENNLNYSITSSIYTEINGTISPSDENIEKAIILTPTPKTVAFFISDGTDPIQGATVTVNGYDAQTTDASGNATISEVSPEENISFTVEAEGYDTYNGTVTVFDEDVDVNVTMEITKYSVTFSVTNDTNPVEGVVVTLSSSAKATDASGVVEFTEIGPEDGIAYTVIANGYDNYAGIVSVVDQDIQVDIILKTTVGISKNRHRSFRIYPNPASDLLNLELENAELADNYKVKIFNQMGGVIYEEPMKNIKHTIDLSDWSGYGLYYLQIIDSEGSIIGIRKIVLQ